MKLEIQTYQLKCITFITKSVLDALLSSSEQSRNFDNLLVMTKKLHKFFTISLPSYRLHSRSTYDENNDSNNTNTNNNSNGADNLKGLAQEPHCSSARLH